MKYLFLKLWIFPTFILYVCFNIYIKYILAVSFTSKGCSQHSVACAAVFCYLKYVLHVCNVFSSQLLNRIYGLCIIDKWKFFERTSGLSVIYCVWGKTEKRIKNIKREKRIWFERMINMYSISLWHTMFVYGLRLKIKCFALLCVLYTQSRYASCCKV